MLEKQTPTELAGKALPWDNLKERMDQLFSDWLTENGESLLATDIKEGLLPPHPQVDVFEKKDHLEVKAELPGMDEDGITIELLDDRLRLTGEKEESKEEKGDTYYRRECRFGSFRRDVPLPWQIDAEKTDLESSFKNGVLKIKIPKPAEEET